MKLWVSMSAAMYLDMLEQNLEHINADIEQDVEVLDLTGCRKHPLWGFVVFTPPVL